MKYFVMFMIVFCSVFLGSALYNKDYVSALIQFVCLIVNIRSYSQTVAREQKQKEIK